MKIARYLAHGQISYGVVEDGMVKELERQPLSSRMRSPTTPIRCQKSSYWRRVSQGKYWPSA